MALHTHTHTNYLAMTLANYILWRYYLYTARVSWMGGTFSHRNSKSDRKLYQSKWDRYTSLKEQVIYMVETYKWQMAKAISHNLLLLHTDSYLLNIVFMLWIFSHSVATKMLQKISMMTLWRSVNALQFFIHRRRACINPSNVIVGRRPHSRTSFVFH